MLQAGVLGPFVRIRPLFPQCPLYSMLLLEFVHSSDTRSDEAQYCPTENPYAQVACDIICHATPTNAVAHKAIYHSHLIITRQA